MGNTESQYSNVIVPGKPKSCSLKFHARKEEVQSPHGWWRASEGVAGYKTRGTGRSYPPQHKTSQPYGAYGSRLAGAKLRPVSPKKCGRGDGSQAGLKNGHYGYLERSGERDGLAGPGQRSPERAALCEPVEGRGSPKVLLSEDGSMRVEFTKARRVPVDGQALSALPSVAPEASLRTSKGSSLSSEGSWYDSPWGNAGELTDNVFACGQNGDSSSGYTTFSSIRAEEAGCGYSSSGYNTFSSARTEDMSPGFNTGLLFPTGDNPASQLTSKGYNSIGYNTCSSGRTEDSGIGDSVILQPEAKDSWAPSAPLPLDELYPGPGVAAPFASAQFQDLPPHRASPSSGRLDAVIQEEGADEQRYTSHTLPCRKAEPVATGNSRKDSLKSRIRRLSDWTGSLSRKKRRLQEPYGNETGEGLNGVFDPVRVNPATQEASLLWNPLLSQTQSQAQAAGCGSTRGLQGQSCHSNVLRQNIYDNFMQELETDCSGPERTEPSDGEDGGEAEGEPGESSSGSQGSLEQLDLLFEKEQGVVRRAGWLSFKPLLTTHKDRKLELVARRRWRQYWVTLKGCTLMFYETYGKSCPEKELSPRYALLAEDSVVQAVPEHPKKENIFCLSNAYGDVYLFQAANQTDLENWVTAIHSASASLLAKRQGKEDTVRLLRSQTRMLLQKIDMDGKMKKMAELQLSVISDQKNRKAIESQIHQWEQNLEKFNMDLFRMRCYLASLQGSELPNPKSLLAVASRPSKSTLGRVGIFSVSSFHALVCTRDEVTLRRRCRSLTRGSRNKRGLFSSLKGLDSLTLRSKEKRQSGSQVFETTGHQSHIPTLCSSERLDALAKLQLIAPSEGPSWYNTLEPQVSVAMPDNHRVTVAVKADVLVSEVVSSVCKERQLDASQHGLRLRRHVGQNTESITPAPTDPVRDLVYDDLEVFPLDVFTIHLSRPSTTTDFGFAVTGHVDGSRKSHVYVSEVHPQGLAFAEGVRAGDEILVLNGTSVSGLDLGLMHMFFSHQSLQLLVRREETGPEDQGAAWPDCDPSGACQPPPPNLLPPWSTDVPVFGDPPQSALPQAFDEAFVLPQPTDNTEHHGQNVETVCSLYQTFPEGRGRMVDGQANPYVAAAAANPRHPCPRHMSVSERLCKVIQELVDTEKSYVKDLSSLFDIYLTPLQSETFLSKDEMESLFGSLPEMLDFQRVFLHTLEEHVASCPDLGSLETPEQFKKLLFSLGGSFLYYADHFKLYSGFCANHIKVQKVLERAKTDRAFKEFLEARNPTKQHSSTLESYLIKPVQRVLKYPLLLRELVSLTDSDSEEHSHLTEALKAMERVASHINEMQKIYEDYGTVFDQLVAEQSGPEKEVTEISMGEFLIHSSEVWLNPLPSLGRMRKNPEISLFVFKSAVILVYRESSKLKKRMTTSRSVDLDPFKFRWLIPVSAVHVRLGNTVATENPCIWELVHTKSQVEGRPETVFQLCSSGLENKASVVKALRSLWRDGTRRPGPTERVFREHTGSLHRSKPLSERAGPWRRRQLRHAEAQRTTGQNHSDEGSVSSGPYPGDTRSEPQLPSRGTGPPLTESSTLGKRPRLCSLTSALEDQLQRLNFTEKPGQSTGSRRQEQTGRANSYYPPQAQRRSASLRSGQSLGMLEEPQCVDLNSLLERDFSDQSMTSTVNEDCFYDTLMGIHKAAIPTL